ncbi:MAG: type IV secretory system conjugative DNA transfer family protein [Patescibacteria group bacterium]
MIKESKFVFLNIAFILSIILYILLFFGVSSSLIFFLIIIIICLFIYMEEGSVKNRIVMFIKSYIESIYKYSGVTLIPIIFFIAYSIHPLYFLLYILSLILLIIFLVLSFFRSRVVGGYSIRLGSIKRESGEEFFLRLSMYEPFSMQLERSNEEVFSSIKVSKSKHQFVIDLLKSFHPGINFLEDKKLKKHFRVKSRMLVDTSKESFSKIIPILYEEKDFRISFNVINPLMLAKASFGYLEIESDDEILIERIRAIYKIGIPHFIIQNKDIGNVMNFIKEEGYKKDIEKETISIMPDQSFFKPRGSMLGYYKDVSRNTDREVYISDEMRLNHSYTIGKTGVGKSTFLVNLILQDIYKGHAVIVLDPHDLVDRIFKFYPNNKKGDLYLIDFKNLKYSFNPLLNLNNMDISLLVDSLVSVFHNLYKDFWGPQSEDILRRSLYALILYNESNKFGERVNVNYSILDIEEFLTDEHFRLQVLQHIEDVEVKYYFDTIYKSWDSRSRNEKIAPILNKIGRIKADRILREFLSGPHEQLNFKKAMLQEKVILFDLKKSVIGDENSKFLGSLLVSQIQNEIIIKNGGPEVYLYIDEFHNFLSDSFLFLFSESRKFKVSINISNQYLTQIPKSIADSIIENSGIFYIFKQGEKSKIKLSKYFNFEIEDIPKYCLYVKILDNNIFTISANGKYQ